MKKKPLLKRIEPSEDIRDIQCPMSIEVSFATSAKISDMGVLDKVLEVVIAEARKKFESEGFKTWVRVGLVKPMTQEELLTIIPRKMHFMRDGRQVCRTEFVSPKNLTDDPKEVTCKLCLKVLE